MNAIRWSDFIDPEIYLTWREWRYARYLKKARGRREEVYILPDGAEHAVGPSHVLVVPASAKLSDPVVSVPVGAPPPRAVMGEGLGPSTLRDAPPPRKWARFTITGEGVSQSDLREVQLSVDAYVEKYRGEIPERINAPGGLVHIHRTPNPHSLWCTYATPPKPKSQILDLLKAGELDSDVSSS